MVRGFAASYDRPSQPNTALDRAARKSWGDSISPVARAATMMGEGENLEQLSAHAVDEVIRKAIQRNAARVSATRASDFRKCLYVIQRPVNSISKLSAEAAPLRLVKIRGRDKFLSRGWMKLTSHRRSRRSISANTSSAGMPRTAPPSKSAARRSISASHAASVSVSLGSRLAISSSASRARSEVGQARSCTARVSALRSTTRGPPSKFSWNLPAARRGWQRATG